MRRLFFSTPPHGASGEGTPVWRQTGAQGTISFNCTFGVAITPNKKHRHELKRPPSLRDYIFQETKPNKASVYIAFTLSSLCSLASRRFAVFWVFATGRGLALSLRLWGCLGIFRLGPGTLPLWAGCSSRAHLRKAGPAQAEGKGGCL